MADTSERKQGPKRSETSRSAILEATRDELADQGWRKFSVDNVAKRAKASKQTIYRWWPSIGAMCVESAVELIPQPATDGRDPVERLTGIFLPLEAAARSGAGHGVLRSAMVAAADDPDAGEVWRQWLQDNMRLPLRMLMAELAAKKVVRRDWALDEAMEQMLGPLWHRLVVMRAPVQDGQTRAQAERLLTILKAD